MQTTYFLSGKDHALLSQLLHNQIPGLFPVPAVIDALTMLLARSRPHPGDPGRRNEYVGIGDQVVLVSPSDSSDTYDPSIVLPSESNLESNRLSVLTPIGLAVIGRRVGETVIWQTPRGEREMKIASIMKSEATPSLGAGSS